jgi:anti-anti-sigma regulatory factor
MNMLSSFAETAAQCCPLCGEELFVTRSEPRSGASCPFCRRPLWFLRNCVDDVLIVTFLGEGKRKNAAPAWSEAALWLPREAAQVVADLSRMTSASHAFFEMLAAMQRKLELAGGAMKLCGLRPKVAESLKNAEPAALFEIYADEQSALKSFTSAVESESIDFPLNSALPVYHPSADAAVSA